MLTLRREAVEFFVNKTSRSAMLAGPRVSTHAVPGHFDVACPSASAELRDCSLFGARREQHR